MNRCITCGKIVGRAGTHSFFLRDGHRYLVCCKLCKEEYARDPEHYINRAIAIYGEFAVKAYSQTVADSVQCEVQHEAENDAAETPESLRGGLIRTQRRIAELEEHFEKIMQSGGLEGLRKELKKHRKMINLLHEELFKQVGEGGVLGVVDEANV